MLYTEEAITILLNLICGNQARGDAKISGMQRTHHSHCMVMFQIFNPGVLALCMMPDNSVRRFHPIAMPRQSALVWNLLWPKGLCDYLSRRRVIKDYMMEYAEQCASWRSGIVIEVRVSRSPLNLDENNCDARNRLRRINAGSETDA